MEPPVKYDDVKDCLLTGDVLLFRQSPTLFGRLIRWYSQSPYSHAGIVLRIKVNGHDRVAVLESLEPWGVRIFPLERYLAQEKSCGAIIDWYQVVDPAVNREKIAAYALDQWGKRYSSPWQFIWSFGRLFTKIRERYELPANVNPGRYFCSQLVAAALEHAGYVPEREWADSADTTPGEVSLFPCLHRRGVLEV